MRKILTTAALSLAAASLLTPALAQDMPSATASLVGVDGTDHGTVTFQQTPNGVLLTADLTGVPAGAHGFHVHETGLCEPGDEFQSAGGHFTGVSDTHGVLVEGGPHSGDMPNIHVPESGDLMIEVLNTRISLMEDGEGYLMDDDGSAIMIHSGADDYESQPSGDAGSRVACGVIEMD